MRSDPRRNFLAILIFWVFLPVGVATLAIGLVWQHAGLGVPAHAYLSDLHVSLGITAALLFLAELLLGILLHLIIENGGPRGPRRVIGLLLRQAIYFSFLAAFVAGALAAIFRGDQIFFWGNALPLLDAGDIQTAARLQDVHVLAAYVFGGLALFYVAFALFNWLFPGRVRALTAAAPSSIAMMIADGLAQAFRFFGGAAFWAQLLIGILSALLLVFSFAGRTVSPSGSIFSESIYWASAALALMVFSTLFGYRYINAAAHIRVHPERYLAFDRRLTFWFVGAGGFLNILGALISFVGVGLSVALLIGKTVSQPPGIAITNPDKIVRALDIFVLLVNFSLFFAHCVGVGVAAWLSISALRARHQYLVAREMARVQEAKSAGGVVAPSVGEAAD